MYHYPHRIRLRGPWDCEPLRRASAKGDAEAGLRLAGALTWFWLKRNHFTEGRQWLEQALSRASDAPAALRMPSVVIHDSDTPALAMAMLTCS